MAPPRELMSPRFARALQCAAASHRSQTRRGSDVPYVEHAVAVAWILERLGFGEDVVIAGLLHDVVEDTEVTLSQVDAQFGPEVARVVADCSEVKLDSQGNKRPWMDRKRDHLAALAGASVASRAVVLADKLHNLLSIELDVLDGRPIWSLFHAERDQVLWYYRATIDQLGTGEVRIEALADRCREALTRIETIGDPTGAAATTDVP
ncbi:MAG: HD domain-containing protein [Isosphaeraceae bacterium]|nr:HD domain-containing protein [Isosphaeraceae bacterium]